MADDYGKIVSISEVSNVIVSVNAPLNGRGGQLGFTAMIGAIAGGGYSCDGYEVRTENERFLVLIFNQQDCYENWGYLSSDDDFSAYIGKTLLTVVLTDTALNQEAVEKSGYYEDCGGIQFVDFKCSDGSTLQLAVYNAHNGYYGHPIFVIKGDRVLLNDTL